MSFPVEQVDFMIEDLNKKGAYIVKLVNGHKVKVEGFHANQLLDDLAKLRKEKDRIIAKAKGHKR